MNLIKRLGQFINCVWCCMVRNYKLCECLGGLSCCVNEQIVMLVEVLNGYVILIGFGKLYCSLAQFVYVGGVHFE